MAFRDGNTTEIPTVTIHSGKLRSIDAATVMQLRSVRHDSYDQFTEIFSSRYLQYPTLPLQLLTSKKSIGPITLSVRNMDDKRGAVLTQTGKVCTHHVRRPPFWLIVTVTYSCSAYCNTNNVQPIFSSVPITHSRQLSFLVLVSLLITGARPAILVEYLSTPPTDTFNESYNQCECIVSLYINTHCHQISDRDTYIHSHTYGDSYIGIKEDLQI